MHFVQLYLSHCHYMLLLLVRRMFKHAFKVFHKMVALSAIMFKKFFLNISNFFKLWNFGLAVMC